jgi:hypothetical protein
MSSRQHPRLRSFSRNGRTGWRPHHRWSRLTGARTRAYVCTGEHGISGGRPWSEGRKKTSTTRSVVSSRRRPVSGEGRTPAAPSSRRRRGPHQDQRSLTSPLARDLPRDPLRPAAARTAGLGCASPSSPSLPRGRP